VELGVAADEIVLLRREVVALPVAPFLVGRVLPLEEDGRRVPVVTLAREIAAPFEEQDAPARGRQLPRQRPSAGATPDDDDVVVIGCRHDGVFPTARGWSA